MRKKFKSMEGKRCTFIATVGKFGKKSAWKGEDETTILLLDIKDESSNPLEDHVWMVCRKRIKECNLEIGDIIQFNARVTLYRKGYREDDDENPFRFDYRLSFPTKIAKIGVNETAKNEYARLQEMESRRMAKMQETVIPVIEPTRPIITSVEIKQENGSQMRLDDFLRIADRK